jgi:hypothetical protein
MQPTDEPPTTDLLSVVTMLDRLHRAGWSIGDAAFQYKDGCVVWLVSGYNGENLIHVESSTRAAAWWAACQQAEAVGMLGRWSGRVGRPGQRLQRPRRQGREIGHAALECERGVAPRTPARAGPRADPNRERHRAARRRSPPGAGA